MLRVSNLVAGLTCPHQRAKASRASVVVQPKIIVTLLGVGAICCFACRPTPTPAERSSGKRALILEASFVEENPLIGSVEKAVESRGRGLGDDFDLTVTRIKKLRLGRFEIVNPVAILGREGTYFAALGRSGNIGGEILRRFTVVFDYSRNRLILEPNHHFAEPFDRTELEGRDRRGIR